jgi:lipopolysaccharide export system permease protein
MRFLKKIDILLMKSFAGPFFVAFGVALFVLIMQFMWLYIDEIAGKGVSILILAELIGYFSVAVFPMALPIAVLISSVMVLGNLAERYELSSMKSAGVSLLRVLRSLIFISIGIGIFSYICSDFLIPKANLRFRSRLHDIRRTKPTLALERGTFNEDFRNFVIRIGDKKADGETIQNVQINDLTNPTLSLNKIMADSGAMYTSDDKKFFVIELYKGTQYQQPSPEPNGNQDGGNKYPFIRTNFRSWNKIWNMSEFDMNRSDEDRFKTQRSMLTMDQLRQQIDSLAQQIEQMHVSVSNDLMAQVDRVKIYKPKQRPQINTNQVKNTDTAFDTGVTPNPDPKTKQLPDAQTILKRRRNKDVDTSNIQPPPALTQQISSRYPAQISPDSMSSVKGGFIQVFAEGERKALLNHAASTLKGHQNTLNTRISQTKDRNKDRVKTAYELYSKYSFALVCVIFLFIGAPMGAIIRKGGFGWPVLVAIIFFVIFIFLTIMCRELAESFVMHPFAAAMMPCLVLIPIATVLTYRSMRDRTLIEAGFGTKVKGFFVNLGNRFKSANVHA